MGGYNRLNAIKLDIFSEVWSDPGQVLLVHFLLIYSFKSFVIIRFMILAG